MRAIKKESEIFSKNSDPTVWVDQHGDFLFQFAWTRVGDRTIAEDLVQECFLAALSQVNKFSGNSSERTWFVGILKHKIADHFRTHGREVPTSSLESSKGPAEELFDKGGWWQVKPGNWPGNPNEVLEKKEFWNTFRHCMENLPQRLRTAFALREMDDRSTHEICEVLNLSHGNLGVVLFRARIALRRCLEINWFANETEGD